MGWQGYNLTYQALSPVYIGHRISGFVQRTRYYIPGRVMWGAVTANLTRCFFNHSKYSNVGNAVKEYVRFSYLFPAIEADKPLLPQYTENGLVFGNDTESYFKEKFEADFIRSEGKTAIKASSNTAEDESLHELEYIANKVRCEDGSINKVLWVGYIFIQEGVEIEGKPIGWDNAEVSLNTAMREIFVGGERKYGFGRLVLKSDPAPLETKQQMFGWVVNKDGEEITLSVPEITEEQKRNQKHAIPAHMKLDESTFEMQGDIEAILGRDRINENRLVGLGQKEGESPLYWVPGSIVTEKMILKMGSFGLLSRVIEETLPHC